ncbi:MAG: DUF5914 domain-containing protein [Myxococcota bacterium]
MSTTPPLLSALGAHLENLVGTSLENLGRAVGDDDGLVPLGRPLPPAHGPAEATRPDWVQADPERIEKALSRALKREGGGWCVVDASRNIASEPKRYVLDGKAWVAWRDDDGQPHLAPNSCPHMGAELHCAKVERGELVCPWHGLKLGKKGRGSWQPVPCHDDGVLIWARILEHEEPTEAPIVSPRPARFLEGTIRMSGRCETQDIVANRLDPWHGVHYHPHSFARLRLLDATDDVLTVRVAYRVAGPLCVEVDCTFHSPQRRSIVMTIVDGDGAGSVVETHATPVRPGETAMVEATLASSDREGFDRALRMQRLVRPFVEKRAKRLWQEDLEYAERRYALRHGETH